jgi:hypothetical protein
MKTIIHFLSYLAQFFRMRMFQTKVVDKIKTFIFNNVFVKTVPFVR